MAQIKALLLKEITPRGLASNIKALLRKRGYVVSVQALGAGTVAIAWYLVPRGAHIAKGTPRPVLIASGHKAFATATIATITIKLTATGTRLLKNAKALKLTAKGSFTQPGKRTVATVNAFPLKR